MGVARLWKFEMEVRKSSGRKVKQKKESRTRYNKDCTSSTSGIDSKNVPLQIILQQCNDLYRLQDDIIRSSTKQQLDLNEQNKLLRKECEGLLKQLENERLEHSKTKYILSMEQEKMHLAMTEVEVLKKQLDREKSTFDEAFCLLKSQALSDASNSENLLAKSTGLELQNAKKDEAIIRLETQVKDLNVRLKELKQSHKVELQEANVRLQQEIYLAKHFKESSGVGTRQPAVKSKQRAKPKSKN